jgi:hypothetical protein
LKQAGAVREYEADSRAVRGLVNEFLQRLCQRPAGKTEQEQGYRKKRSFPQDRPPFVKAFKSR